MISQVWGEGDPLMTAEKYFLVGPQDLALDIKTGSKKTVAGKAGLPLKESRTKLRLM